MSMERGFTTDLTPTERIQVAMVMQMDGWKIIKEKLMQARVIQARDEVTKIQPDENDRATKLEAVQLYAFAVSKFYHDLTRDIECNAKAATQVKAV